MTNNIDPKTLGFFEQLLYNNSGSFLVYALLFGIIFAESGLLVGFFLPGDTLLLGAGILAYAGIINIWFVILACFAGAVIGDSVGYMLGKRYGKKLFQREDSAFFHKKHLINAENFYAKHGVKTIILARFVPIVRTFAPTVAGMGNMKYSTFLVYNLIGGALWTVGLTLVGYLVTGLFPNAHIEKFIEPIILGVVVCSVVPAIYHLWKSNQKSKPA